MIVALAAEVSTVFSLTTNVGWFELRTFSHGAVDNISKAVKWRAFLKTYDPLTSAAKAVYLSNIKRHG